MLGRFSPRGPRDQLRALIPVCAVAVLVVAAITDPGSAGDVALGAIAVVALSAWAYAPSVPLPAVAVAVLVPVALAQRSGALEPLMFEACLLAIIAGRDTSLTGVVVGVIAVAEPAVVSLIQDHPDFSVGIWTLAIAFSWFVARAVTRQEHLAAELHASRRELERQALLEERRRIARDVHDFVGHGLAGMMLQVTSARHVLRRDPDAAEEALASAEEVGRRSMQELRRTVALLRNENDASTAPLPSADGIPNLVDDARAGGLAVELRLRGDQSAIDESSGLTLYRIAQEALANAARHAPHARTVLSILVDEGHALLEADTIGPTLPIPAGAAPGRGYGVIGMRERATALGGELTAGPTASGWALRCRLPLDAHGSGRAGA